MSKVDKNKAVISYILQCPQIVNSPLFFNAIKAEDESKQIVTVANDANINKPFVDGSVLKRYTFTIIVFKSVTYNRLVTDGLHNNENVDELVDVQDIMDWVDEQNDARNYPDFGSDCEVEDISTTTNIPRTNGIDTTLTPALIKYSITIQINYLDKSKSIWNKQETQDDVDNDN